MGNSVSSRGRGWRGQIMVAQKQANVWQSCYCYCYFSLIGEYIVVSLSLRSSDASMHPRGLVEAPDMLFIITMMLTQNFRLNSCPIECLN